MEMQDSHPDRALSLNRAQASTRTSSCEETWVDVVIEIPRGGFLKRGSTGELDFVSPLPCPFNYGSVHEFIGLEGDFLDAVVLGPRLAPGTRVRVRAFGAVGLTDRGMYDDKLICARQPPGAVRRFLVLCFFHLYACCKALLNLLRGYTGRNSCEGWNEVGAAIARATPNDGRPLDGPKVGF